MSNETQFASQLLSRARKVREHSWTDETGRVVYFIQAASGPIKIGVSWNAKSRLSNLRSHNPEPLTLLATMPGSFKLEKFLHAELAVDRVTGEWFKPTPNLLSFAALVKKTYGEQEKPRRYTSPNPFKWTDPSPLADDGCAA